MPESGFHPRDVNLKSRTYPGQSLEVYLSSSIQCVIATWVSSSSRLSTKKNVKLQNQFKSLQLSYHKLLVDEDYDRSKDAVYGFVDVRQEGILLRRRLRSLLLHRRCSHRL